MYARASGFIRAGMYIAPPNTTLRFVCAGGGTWSGVDYFYIRKLIKNMSLTTLARLLFRCVAPHSIAPPFKSARSVRRYTSPCHIFPLRFNLCRGRDLSQNRGVLFRLRLIKTRTFSDGHSQCLAPRGRSPHAPWLQVPTQCTQVHCSPEHYTTLRFVCAGGGT